MSPGRPRILVIDNYDSFTYNLVQYLGDLGAEPVIRRNDRVELEEIARLRPWGIVISPGPGRPEQAGITLPLVRSFSGKVPLLGVCLGHQAIGAAFGGQVVPAPTLVHGKTSQIHHDGRTIFRGLENPFPATRYHSLVVDRESLPAALEVSAETPEGVLMGLRHRELRVEGVQFHPESVMTAAGKKLLRNFLEFVSGAGDLARLQREGVRT
ncbi:MAG: aminodeoxychorismate/anthranilate synthase component II [Acidobacteria bacterium]|nr:aminodeoxychorismate/anthranilate synthase component II [Acidobacteriota bacterium]